MKPMYVIIAVILAGLLLLAYVAKLDTITSLFQSGFTDDQLRRVEQDIRGYYVISSVLKRRIPQMPELIVVKQVALKPNDIQANCFSLLSKNFGAFWRLHGIGFQA